MIGAPRFHAIKLFGGFGFSVQTERGFGFRGIEQCIGFLVERVHCGNGIVLANIAEVIINQ